MKTPIELSIIIVNYNSQELLDANLNSIYAWSDRDNFEVIVVDNFSWDNSCKIVKEKYPQVKLISNNRNWGFGKANNIGVSQALGKYILLINPDTIARCNLVEESLKFFAQYPDNRNAFGGMLIDLNGKEQRGSRRSFPTLLNAFLHFSKLSTVFNYKKLYDLSGNPITMHPVECVSGACIGLPKTMYESIGGFDEKFFLHFEDIDLCKRIWEKGYRLWFYPNLTLMHVKGGSSNISREVKLKVNKWFLESLAIYLWKWNKIDAIIFSPILLILRLVSWFKNWQNSQINKKQTI
jgi:GT2 family glycosyltransferase